MTQVFYCNFDRIMEDKEKLVDSNTVLYYKANRVITNILTITEILYCLLSMVLLLLIIYWNA